MHIHTRGTGLSYSQAAEIELVDPLDIAVGAADGDDVAEIYALTYGDSRFTTRVHRMDERLLPLYSFDLDWSAIGLAIEDSLSGRRNVLVFEGTGRLVAVDAVSGGEVWRSPPLNGGVRDVQFVDPQDDATLGTTRDTFVTGL